MSHYIGNSNNSNNPNTRTYYIKNWKILNRVTKEAKNSITAGL
jgi:hypothetical protein